MSDGGRIALVLSGGASKGSFQAGVMAGLEQAGIEPTIFTGVSVGALNAALAAEYGVGGVWWFWKDINLDDVYTQYGFFRTIWRMWTEGGLMGSAPLEKMIEEHVHPEKIVENGKILRIGATNLSNGHYDTFGPDDARFKRALLASTTIPMTVPPVTIDGDPYVDGGVRNITPIGDAIKFGPDRIILVGTQMRSDYTGPPQKLFGSVGLGLVKHAIDTVVNEGFESDFREFERINELLAIEGNTHPRYRYIPCTSIFPESDMGSGMVFTPELHQKRFAMGLEAAFNALKNYAD